MPDIDTHHHAAEKVDNQVKDNSDKAVLTTADVVTKADFGGGDQAAQKTLNRDLAEQGIMPAMDRKELGSTLASAAEASLGKNLGNQGEHGASSGSAVSKLLRASGEDLKGSPNIENLKDEMVKSGKWEEHEYKAGDKLPAGAVVMTDMHGAGRNVGIVGGDGKIISHDRNSDTLAKHDKWTSKWTSVLTPKDS